MVQVHSFKDGSTIKAFPGNPQFGRLIVASEVSTFTFDSSGGVWENVSTRVAFVKGKVADLEARYGSLKKGDIFSDQLTVIQKEATTPFYTKADGTAQDPKVRPAYKDKDGVEHPAEPILHNGAPVYMQYALAPAGTKDELIGTASVEATVSAEADLA